jgi:hypothetical protein
MNMPNTKTDPDCFIARTEAPWQSVRPSGLPWASRPRPNETYRSPRPPQGGEGGRRPGEGGAKPPARSAAGFSAGESGRASCSFVLWFGGAARRREGRPLPPSGGGEFIGRTRHCESLPSSWLGLRDVAIHAAVQFSRTPKQAEKPSGLPRGFAPCNDDGLNPSVF